MCSGSFECMGARSHSLLFCSVPPHPGMSPEGASALPAHRRAQFTPGLPSLCQDKLEACHRKGHQPRGRHRLQEGQRETEVLTVAACAACTGSLETTVVGTLEGAGSGCELLGQQQQN